MRPLRSLSTDFALILVMILMSGDLMAQTDIRISPPDPTSYQLPADAQIQGAATLDGRTLVVWGNRSVDGDGTNVNHLAGRLISAGRADTISVHSDDARPYGFVGAMTFERGFLVVWNDRRLRSPGIYLGRFDRSGKWIGEEVRIGGVQIHAGEIWLLEPSPGAPVLLWNSRSGNSVGAAVARLDATGAFRDGYSLPNNETVSRVLSFSTLPGASIVVTGRGRALYMHPDGRIDAREVTRALAATGHIAGDSSTAEVAGGSIRLYPNLFDSTIFRTVSIPAPDTLLAGTLTVTRSHPDQLTIAYMTRRQRFDSAGFSIDVHAMRVDMNGILLSDSVVASRLIPVINYSPYCQALRWEDRGSRISRGCDNRFDVTVEYVLVYSGSCEPSSQSFSYHIAPNGEVGGLQEGSGCPPRTRRLETWRIGSDSASSIAVAREVDTILLSEPVPGIIAPFDEFAPALFIDNDTLCSAWTADHLGGYYQTARDVGANREWLPVGALNPRPLQTGSGAHNHLYTATNDQRRYAYALNNAFAVVNVCLLRDYYWGAGGHSTFEYMKQTSSVGVWMPSASGWKTGQSFTYADDYQRPDQTVESVASSPDGDVIVSVVPPGGSGYGPVPKRVIGRLRRGVPGAVWKDGLPDIGPVSLLALGGDTVIAISGAKGYILENGVKIGEIPLIAVGERTRYFPLNSTRFVRLDQGMDAGRYRLALLDISGSETASREFSMPFTSIADVALTRNPNTGEIAVLWSAAGRIHGMRLGGERLDVIRDAQAVSDSNGIAAHPNALFHRDTLHVVWDDARNGGRDIYYRAVDRAGISPVAPQIEARSEISILAISPVPASERLTVSFASGVDSEITVELVAVDGGIAGRWEFEGGRRRTSVTLPIELIEPGVYLLRVTGAGSVVSKPVVVNR